MFHISDPPEFLAAKMEISCSENANFAVGKYKFCNHKMQFSAKDGNSIPQKCKFCTQKLQCRSKQTTQNSALRKWKFCTRKMENFPNVMESWLSAFSANRAILQCRAQVEIPRLNSAFAESWRDCHIHNIKCIQFNNSLSLR